MNGKNLTVLALVLVLAGAIGCSSKPSGAEQSLRDFYGDLNHGEFAEAMARYEDDVREYIEDPDQTGMSFADWAKGETKNGTIHEIRVLTETAHDGTAELEFELEYADGTSSRRKVSLTEVGGEWKLGAIG